MQEFLLNSEMLRKLLQNLSKKKRNRWIKFDFQLLIFILFLGIYFLPTSFYCVHVNRRICLQNLFLCSLNYFSFLCHFFRISEVHLRYLITTLFLFFRASEEWFFCSVATILSCFTLIGLIHQLLILYTFPLYDYDIAYEKTYLRIRPSKNWRYSNCEFDSGNLNFEWIYFEIFPNQGST